MIKQMTVIEHIDERYCKSTLDVDLKGLCVPPTKSNVPP